jgi:Flp pilus assembly protein TadD
LKERHPAAPELLYNVGCSLALLGRPEEAVASLQRAADTGWWEVRNAERDNDLVGLRGRPDFEKF